MSSSDCEVKLVGRLPRSEVRDQFPELYEKEVPVVERVGKKSWFRDYFDLYQVTLDGKTYSALSEPLLRKKLEGDCPYAFLDATELSNKALGERVMIKDTKRHNWLVAIRDGVVFNKHGNPLRVENGRVFQNLAMSA